MYFCQFVRKVDKIKRLILILFLLRFVLRNCLDFGDFSESDSIADALETREASPRALLLGPLEYSFEIYIFYKTTVRSLSVLLGDQGVED